MARFTYEPSANSRAARAAISSRGRGMRSLPFGSGGDGAPLDALLDGGADLDDAGQVDPRQVHAVRIQLGGLDELFDVRDARATADWGERVEVAGRLVEHQVAVAIALGGVHEGEVGDDRVFEDVVG